MMSYRIGIVGGGNISETHARAALEIPGVEVAAIYGRNAERVRGLAEKYGGTAYDSYAAMLDEAGLDAVLLGSPSGLHAEQGIAAARKGVHVLTEKPVDTGTERADELVRECESAGVKLGVFFQDRTSPDLVWLKELIDAGGLGRPILVSARAKWYRPPEYYAGSRWRGTWALDGGGALMNQGVHTVDLLLWLYGEVSTVQALTRTALHDIEVDDTTIAALAFASGAVGTFEATTAAYPGYPRRVELTGTNGTVIVENDRVIAVDLREQPSTRPPRAGEASAPPRGGAATVSDVSGHRRVLEDFLGAIESGGTPRSNGREGRRSVALIEAIYESSRTGSAVSPRPAPGG
jgi:UDP-N-acetyl-2-amino-2-deoxyglucuronate dehydrogenase